MRAFLHVCVSQCVHIRYRDVADWGSRQTKRKKRHAILTDSAIYNFLLLVIAAIAILNFSHCMCRKVVVRQKKVENNTQMLLL